MKGIPIAFVTMWQQQRGLPLSSAKEDAGISGKILVDRYLSRSLAVYSEGAHIFDGACRRTFSIEFGNLGSTQHRLCQWRFAHRSNAHVVRPPLDSKDQLGKSLTTTTFIET